MLATAVVAGEVQLRGVCQASATLVRLADVAEFIDVPDADRHEIEQLQLFPAPQAGLSRTVTAQDVRETMSLYGLSLPALRITGQCRVEGTANQEAKQGTLLAAGYRVADAEDDSQGASRPQLGDLLVAYLKTKERIRTQWKVEPQLSAAQSEAIASMELPEVSGGRAPWTGRQVFSIRDRNAAGGKPTTFKADVVRIARAVIARRQLDPGDVVGADDVEVAEVNPVALTASALVQVDDALDKEVKQTIAAGQVVSSSSLRRPLVVKRGELITVYSLAAGIQVKATAKALANAALGDVILLEAIETRKQFQGRVTAPQEAMVFVDSPKVAAEPSPTSAERVAGRKTR